MFGVVLNAVLLLTAPGYPPREDPRIEVYNPFGNTGCVKITLVRELKRAVTSSRSKDVWRTGKAGQPPSTNRFLIAAGRYVLVVRAA
jgi:hypothetical protein